MMTDRNMSRDDWRQIMREYEEACDLQGKTEILIPHKKRFDARPEWVSTEVWHELFHSTA